MILNPVGPKDFFIPKYPDWRKIDPERAVFVTKFEGKDYAVARSNGTVVFYKIEFMTSDYYPYLHSTGFILKSDEIDIPYVMEKFTELIMESLL